MSEHSLSEKRSWLEKGSWIAGILGVLIAVFALVQHDSGSTITQTSGNGSNQFGTVVNGNGNVIVNSAKSAQQAGDSVDISGRWDSAKAYSIAFSLLQEHHWGDTTSRRHTLYGEYSLLYRSKRETRILVMASIERDGLDTTDDEMPGCHACQPSVSFFEFERLATGWKLITTDIAVIQWGSWGKLDSNSVDIQAVGNDQFGVLLTSENGNQGFYQNYTSLFIRSGDSFREALSFITGAINYEHNGERYGSKITFEPTYAGLFDMHVKSKGRLFHHTYLNSCTYRFNGQRYVLSEGKENEDFG